MVSCESFLLVPITPDGPRLIQPTTNIVATAVDPAVAVGNGPALLVERQPGRGYAAIADRADHQLHGHLLALAGVLGRHPAAVVGDQLVVAEHDLLDPLLAGDLDG